MFRCCRRASLELDDITPPLRASLENIPLPHHEPYRFRQIEKILLRLQKEQGSLEILEDVMDQLGLPGDSIAGLLRFFGTEVDDDELASFFNDTLPFIARLAVDLPNLMAQKLPYLRAGTTRSVSLSRVQCGSLLACAFFCIMPPPLQQARCNELNFTRLYAALVNGGNTAAKMRCLIVYFEALRIRMPQGHVVIQRRCVDPLSWEQWRSSTAQLRGVDIREDGIIEDAGPRALQCDFANKYIGGGVLSRGCVQEEIMFIVAPELIVSVLVTEVLEDNEVVFITGADQFAAYEGYGSDFRCNGAHHEPHTGQRTIVAMDALMFQRGYLGEQVGEDVLLRELNKARAAFLLGPNDPRVPVATGNWGCGAFGGDPELKAVIQVMAAAVTGRDIWYYTFGDERIGWLGTSLRMLHEYRFTAGMLAELLLRLSAEHASGNVSDNASVLEWLSDNMGDVERLRKTATPKRKPSSRG